MTAVAFEPVQSSPSPQTGHFLTQAQAQAEADEDRELEAEALRIHLEEVAARPAATATPTSVAEATPPLGPAAAPHPPAAAALEALPPAQPASWPTPQEAAVSVERRTLSRNLSAGAETPAPKVSRGSSDSKS
jgi:hypothetical protein